MQLPERVKAGLKKYYPDTGDAWLEGFPAFISATLEDWDLTIERFAPEGWPTNVVFFVTNTSGKSLVLKVGHPHDEAETERIYLQAQSSNDVVRLLASRPGFALLMERVLPGTTLRDEMLNPDSIRAAMRLHVALPRPASGLAVPTFRSWLETAFSEYQKDQSPDPLFSRYCNQALVLFDGLPGEDVLLHGDLHHENILRAQRGWQAIDPKGVLGPAVLEFGRFLHNFIGDEVPGEVTQAASREVLLRRIREAVSVSPYSEQRLVEVTFIDLTLSMCWSLNSVEDRPEGFTMLAALNELLSQVS